MNILITAGGTTEKIDNVRTISNNSTGKLGAETANAFIKAPGLSVDKIFYLCGQNAILPESTTVKIIRISSVADLVEKLSEILMTTKIDVVIHSMAVSDYTVDSITTISNMAASISSFLKDNEQCNTMAPELLAAKIVEASFLKTDSLNSVNKISSDINDMIITMKRTPKVIGMIKKLQPSTLLVGFKLLSNVTLDTLIDTGYNLLLKNNCDLVLANDLTGINEKQHKGYLIAADKTFVIYDTKYEIANGIVSHVRTLLEKS